MKPKIIGSNRFFKMICNRWFDPLGRICLKRNIIRRYLPNPLDIDGGLGFSSLSQCNTSNTQQILNSLRESTRYVT